MLRTRLLVISLAALCVGVAPAMADLAVVIDSSETMLTIDSKASQFDLTALGTARDSGSRMTAQVQDTVTTNTLDGIRIDGYSMSLGFHFLGAGNAYTANGSFKLGDVSATTTWDMEADFTSSSVALVTVGGEKRLEIQGSLSPISGNPSILMGSEPWVFTGTAQSGPANADGVLTTITIPGAFRYDTGGLVAMYYPVFGQPSSLQDLFNSASVGTHMDNGSVQAQVVVPVPAAFLLGFLGLGAAGLKLRRYA